MKPKPWHGLKVRWEWGIHALDLEVDASPDALPPTFFKFGVLRKEIYDKDKNLVQPESMRPAPHGSHSARGDDGPSVSANQRSLSSFGVVFARVLSGWPTSNPQPNIFFNLL